MNLEIKTERLYLKKFNKTDAEKYLKIVKDNKIKKYLEYVKISDLEEARETLQIYSECDFENDFYLSIKEKNTDNLIGGIIAVRTLGTILELAYFIDKKYRQKGYCTEALKGFIQYMKLNTNYKVIQLEIKKQNKNSIKVAEKICAEYTRKIYNGYKIYLINV